ncbi:50S ribosomal protein L13 [Candidatus Pacearchaeota archaeon]|nr:50S ribosomal protein L13 [Candidatus Pacearchaeota archaeon]
MRSSFVPNLVIDAKGAVLGRVASYAAKQALLGKVIAIVNCKYVLITGRRGNSIEEYNAIRRRGGSSLKGPFFPKNPERIVKRTIRGMLNYQQQRGLDAFKRVMCYNDVPSEFANSSKISMVRKTTAKTIDLEDLSREI